MKERLAVVGFCVLILAGIVAMCCLLALLIAVTASIIQSL